MRVHLILLLTAFTLTQVIAQNKKPNIIFILADDLGYGNVSRFNAKSPIKTPNIDRMATEGTMFTHFYAGSTVCAPSRGSLMTGLHMGHAYIRGNAASPLRLQDTTVAQRLQAIGYVTGMFGKWSLGENNQAGAAHLKGFNEFFGYTNQTHAHEYFTDHLDEIIKGVTQSIKVDSNRYSQDMIMEKALTFIQKNKSKPFFLYLPFTLPHAELRVTDAMLKEFQNPDGSSKFPPEKPFKKQGDLHTQAQPHAALAAMITHLDRDVARILDAVKQAGLDDNTYIFFTSDNGPHMEGGGDPEYFNSSGPFRGIKRDLYEGGIRMPLVIRAPGKVPVGKVSNVPWAFWDILPTFCDLAGAKIPKDIDGFSFVPAIAGKTQHSKHAYLYWQFNEGGFKEAVVQGDWKLIRFKKKGSPEVLELYNLATDIGEKNNVVVQNPAKVNELKTIMLHAKSPAENKAFDWSDVEQ